MKLISRNKTDLIIAYILEHPEAKIKVSEVARTLRVNKGSASLAIGGLEKAKIVKNWHVELANPLTRALKILITVEKFSNTAALDILQEAASAAGLYGSSSKGTDTEASDIDLWIKPRYALTQLDVSKMSKRLSEILDKRVQIVALNKSRLEGIKKESPNFYYSLIFGSLVLFGEEIG